MLDQCILLRNLNHVVIVETKFNTIQVSIDSSSSQFWWVREIIQSHFTRCSLPNLVSENCNLLYMVYYQLTSILRHITKLDFIYLIKTEIFQKTDKCRKYPFLTWTRNKWETYSYWRRTISSMIANMDSNNAAQQNSCWFMLHNTEYFKWTIRWVEVVELGTSKAFHSAWCDVLFNILPSKALSLELCLSSLLHSITQRIPSSYHWSPLVDIKPDS